MFIQKNTLFVRIAILFGIAFQLAACKPESKIVYVEVNVASLASQTVYVSTWGKNGLTVMDSMMLDRKGRAKKSFSLDYLPQVFVFSSVETGDEVVFTASPDDRIEIVEKEDGLHVSGNSESTLFSLLQEEYAKSIRRIDSLKRAAVDTSGLYSQDSIRVVRKFKVDSIYSQLKQEVVDYAKQHPFWLTSAIVLHSATDSLTPLLPLKDYAQIHKFVDSCLQVTYPDNPILESFRRIAGEMEQVNKAKVDHQKIGLMAKLPRFEIVAVDSQVVRLPDYTTSLWIIDFWGDWCNLCSANEQMYGELLSASSNKSIKIVRVAVNSDKSNVVKLAKADTLGIIYAIEQQNSGLLDSLGITYLPSNMLLNRYGWVIGKDLFGRELTQKVDEYFKTQLKPVIIPKQRVKKDSGRIDSMVMQKIRINRITPDTARIKIPQTVKIN
ncbi:MAG: redoxin domain-containing protein [Bacteroidales bacterium]|nr:redoxin domain-containing protein [Bacteroidales bacterium]